MALGFNPLNAVLHPAISQIVVLFYIFFVLCRSCVLFVCKCVLRYCRRVTTQLQLINISYIFALR